MKAKNMNRGMMRHAVFTGVLVALMAGITGCAMQEPLRGKHLQDEAKDPRVSIVLLHFKTQQLPPEKGLSEGFDRLYLRWIFAVANKSTGWNFRRLDEFNMVFKTLDASMEPDTGNVGTGWVTYLAPTGLNYIAVTSYATGLGHGGLDLVATPFSDHISVGHSATRAKSGSWLMDFIDTPRFAVQVAEPRSLIYAGTVVRDIKCAKSENKPSTCPYELTVIDESELARTFVRRYQSGFTDFSPIQTQLLSIPQTRTIEIRSGSAGQ